MSNHLSRLVGIVFILIGIATFAWIPFSLLQSKWIGDSFLNTFDATAASGIGPDTLHIGNTKVFGKLAIPKLSLVAPIVEGTSPSDLQTAVGHLSTSVLPGQKGSSVLAAHNVTWFRHLDQLKPGDTIQVVTQSQTITYRVTGAKVVHVGYNAPNTPNSSLIMETCYPLNTWYWTSERYLIFASLVKIN
jgi:sortase A